MCYIVFVRHSLHWRYIKIALRKYVITIFNVKIEWNSRGHILFDIYGIPTENVIPTTCQSNAKEMYVNLDAEKNSR